MKSTVVPSQKIRNTQVYLLNAQDVEKVAPAAKLSKRQTRLVRSTNALTRGSIYETAVNKLYNIYPECRLRHCKHKHACDGASRGSPTGSPQDYRRTRLVKLNTWLLVSVKLDSGWPAISKGVYNRHRHDNAVRFHCNGHISFYRASMCKPFGWRPESVRQQMECQYSDYVITRTSGYLPHITAALSSPTSHCRILHEISTTVNLAVQLFASMTMKFCMISQNLT